MLPDGIRKIGAVVMISDEALFLDLGWQDARFIRKHDVVETPPSEDAWKRYKRALKGLKWLEDYEGTEWGGPDYGTEVLPPSARYTYNYHETHEEWLARCREIMKGWND